MLRTNIIRYLYKQHYINLKKHRPVITFSLPKFMSLVINTWLYQGCHDLNQELRCIWNKKLV